MPRSAVSPRTFFRDVFVNLVAGLAAGAIAAFFAGTLWLGILAGVIVVVVIFVFSLWRKYERELKLFLSINAGYYRTFELEENPTIWSDVETSFCYLGISGDSIMEFLKRWMEEVQLPSYRLLLMKPGSEGLKRQEAFHIGHDLNVKLNTLSLVEINAVNEAAKATSIRIESALSLLKNSAPYKDLRMKIKLYDEFSPWWMYILDDRKAYMGILKRGKRGIKSPVFIVEKHKKYVGPFDAFKNNWERMWEKADDA